jgi:hypothetical protein
VIPTVQQARDGGVIKIRQNLPLTAKTEQHRSVLCESALQSLNSNFFTVKIVGAGGQIDFAHSAFSQQAQQLVNADVSAGEILLGGNLLYRVQYWVSQETHGFALRLKQGFDLFSQLSVIATGFIKECDSFVRLLFESGIEQGLNTDPPIRSWRCSHSYALLG